MLPNIFFITCIIKCCGTHGEQSSWLQVVKKSIDGFNYNEICEMIDDVSTSFI